MSAAPSPPPPAFSLARSLPSSLHSPSLSNDRPRRRTRKWPKTPCKTTTGDSTSSGQMLNLDLFEWKDSKSKSSFFDNPTKEIIHFFSCGWLAKCRFGLYPPTPSPSCPEVVWHTATTAAAAAAGAARIPLRLMGQ